jgi:hypothetical protein
MSSPATGPHPIALASLAIAVGFVLWFGLLHPLWPRSLAGWFVAVGAGVATMAWGAVCALAIGWLQRGRRNRWLRNAAAFVVAISLGGGVFAAAVVFRGFIEANFGYVGK